MMFDFSQDFRSRLATKEHFEDDNVTETGSAEIM